MLRRKRLHHLAHIRVVGLGGGGITAVNHMIASGVSGVDFITLDTDAHTLRTSRAPVSFHIQEEPDYGLPSPHLSRQLATPFEPTLELLREYLTGSDMVFLVGGFGGQTATRLAPIVAATAQQQKALTTAIVTMPFSFEGERRTQFAEQGIRRLRKYVNTLIVIPNDRLLEMAGGALAFHETYHLANEIWRESVQGISVLVNAPGLVNVDFADVRSIMAGGGASIIATGRGRGTNRAMRAAENATRSPYMDVTIDGARGVLFNITGGPDMSLHEVKQAAAVIKERADAEANIIFGAAIDVTLKDEIRITVVATGCGFTLPQPQVKKLHPEDLMLAYWQEPSSLSYA